MNALFHTFWREWVRSRRSGLWNLGGALFSLVQGFFFLLVLGSMSGAQPMPISPLKWMWGGDIMFLFLFALILPVLPIKAFAEERQLQTWDPLLCTGQSSLSLATSKVLALYFQWSLWFLCLIPHALVVLIFGSTPLAHILMAGLGLWLCGCFWLSLGSLVCSRQSSTILAYASTSVACLLTLLFPFGRLILPDSFYRILFNSLDIRAFLDRSSDGRILLFDLVLLLGLIALLLWWTACRLENERQAWSKRWKGLLWQGSVSLLSLFLIYSLLVIFHHRPVQWSAPTHTSHEFSKEFQETLKNYPEDLSFTVALPKNLSIPTYQHGRSLILNFVERVAATTSTPISTLDPDVDLRAMERLQQEGVTSKNKIGFVVVRRGEKELVLSYNQWISLATMTVDSKAHRYIRAFHGETLLTRAVNALSRTERAVRGLVIAGHREVDLLQSSPIGGSAIAEMLQQTGILLEYRRPGVDEIDLDRYDLVFFPDSRDKPGRARRELIQGIFEKKIPTLLIRSAIGYAPDKDDPWKIYGVDAQPHTLVQEAYGHYDPFTAPITSISNHTAMRPLQGQVILFDRCRPLKEGAPIDPRLVSSPLLRVDANPAIWGEWEVDFSKARRRYAYDANDLPSPFLTALAVEHRGKEGAIPSLLVVGSRAPFENRMFYLGANRRFAFQCFNWLLEDSDRISLPPRPPSDHRFRISTGWYGPIRWSCLLFAPLLLLISWWWSRLRR